MEFKSRKMPLKFRWFFMFSVQKDFARMDQFTRRVDIVAIKPYAYPGEGRQWTKKYYKGMWLRFSFRLPFAVESWR